MSDVPRLFYYTCLNCQQRFSEEDVGFIHCPYCGCQDSRNSKDNFIKSTEDVEIITDPRLPSIEAPFERVETVG